MYNIRMSNTRLLAIHVLLEIFNNGSKPKQAIESLASSLDKRDRAFLMEIVYGVLRFRDAIDWILGHFLKRPARLGDFTRNNLRIGLYQVLFMRVPDWALVNESVEIEKTGSAENETKPSLVNAVLRNVIRQKDGFKLPLPIGDPVLSIAVNTSHPKWMVKRWVKRFGPEEAALLAEANNKIPPLTIRTNTLRLRREELLGLLAGKGVSAEPCVYSPEGITLTELRAYSDLSFAEGLFAVQDEASQLIGHLLDPKPGQRILDACAAPGGKTTHMAQLMQDTGEVFAVEKDGKRIKRLRENVEKLGLKSVKIVRADAGELRDMGTFDVILVDAPCSATGVIRRNPDIKYRLKAQDLKEYGAKQTALVRSVSPLLRKKGMLGYSVCSVEPEEGEQVIEAFRKTESELEIVEGEIAMLRDLTDRGILRTYPHKHNMDGFFGALLCRKG